MISKHRRNILGVWNQCIWTAERGVDGDEVHKGNAVTKVVRGDGDAFNSFEMQWETILGFWFEIFDLISPKSSWLLGEAWISGIWVRVQLGRGFKQKTQSGGGFHSPDSHVLSVV